MREKKLTQSLDSRVSSLEQALNRRNMEEIVNKITWEWKKTLGKKKRIQKGYFCLHSTRRIQSCFYLAATKGVHLCRGYDFKSVCYIFQ